MSNLVGKYDYTTIRTESWLSLRRLPVLPPPVPAKQQEVMIPGDQPEEGIDGYGGKDFEKRKV